MNITKSITFRALTWSLIAGATFGCELRPPYATTTLLGHQGVVGGAVTVRYGAGLGPGELKQATIQGVPSADDAANTYSWTFSLVGEEGSEGRWFEFLDASGVLLARGFEVIEFSRSPTDAHKVTMLAVCTYESTLGQPCAHQEGNGICNGTEGCTLTACGDGVHDARNEQCDDGNGSNNDRCLTDCTSATCGDGHTWSTDSGTETCDDGNTTNTDDCPDGTGGTCRLATCGDGFLRTGTEQCDDGNKDNSDDCPDGVGGTCVPAVCGDGLVRAGVETCDDGNQVNADSCPDGTGGTCDPATCGDGHIYNTDGGTEVCDDGNGDNTDACPDGPSGTCKTAFCGDGLTCNGSGCATLLGATEACDGGAGCTQSCTTQPSGSKTEGAPCGENADCLDPLVCTDQPGDGTPIPVCANLSQISEVCDETADCATGLCDTQADHQCEPIETCGNGTVEATSNAGHAESCDDGNITPTDGCNASCLRENNEPCSTDLECEGICDATEEPDMCESINNCGNSRLEGTEICDDGNITPTDGCNPQCKTENDGSCDSNGDCGNVCINGSCANKAANTGPCDEPADCISAICDANEVQPVCEPANQCGNGRLEGAEQCDDGNTNPNDTCSADCFKTTGQTCTASTECVGVCDLNEVPSVCEDAGQCGNGAQEANEECDDGNEVNDANGCDTLCTYDQCGDGVKQEVEICDEGQATTADCHGGTEIEGVRCTLTTPPGMVNIPAGDFWMGCNVAVETGCNTSRELPYHLVTLDAYAIDKYEVTADKYKTCVAANGCTSPSTTNPYCSGFSAPYNNWDSATDAPRTGRGNHPVNCVNWEKAVTYCAWKGIQDTGTAYMLPTEAQWEKAARGGCELYGDCGAESRKYPWGDMTATCTYAVMDDGGDGCGENGTWPVGSKSPTGDSLYGLKDMAGNVWEWTRDWYSATYYSSSPETNPENTTAAIYRSRRGGSWLNNASGLRASSRSSGYPANPFIHSGFRCSQ
jgi:cysteine-rich repeat protein